MLQGHELGPPPGSGGIEGPPDIAEFENADATLGELITKRLREAILPTEAIELAPEAMDVLRSAWVLAAQLQHRAVLPEHVVVAMLAGDLDTGPASRLIRTDQAATVRLRALAALAPVKTAAGEQHVAALFASPDLLSWIGEAAKYALERSGEYGRLIGMDDLVEAVRVVDSAALRGVHRLFHPAGEPVADAATSVEDSGLLDLQQPQFSFDLLLSDTREARRTSASAQQSASRARTEVRRLNRHVSAVVEEVTQLSNGIQAQSATARETSSELRSVLPKLAGLGEQAQDLRRVVGELDEAVTRLSPVAGAIGTLEQASSQLAQTVDRHKHAIGELDRQVQSLGGRLPPPPPSAARLALAIVAVLALGVGVGSALTQLGASPGPASDPPPRLATSQN